MCHPIAYSSPPLTTGPLVQGFTECRSGNRGVAVNDTACGTRSVCRCASPPCHECRQSVAANPPFQHQREIPVTDVRIVITDCPESSDEPADDKTSVGIVLMQRFKLQSKAARQAHLG